MRFREETNLIGSGGRPTFGLHRLPLNNLNIEDFRPHGRPDITLIERGIITGFRIKRWLYLGVCTEDIIFGIAVIHLGYLSNFFVNIFDRKEKKLNEYGINQPFAIHTFFDGSFVNGNVDFIDKDINAKIELKNDEILLKASVKNELDANLRFLNSKEQLSLVTRVGLKGFNYTNKEAGIPVSGTLKLFEKIFQIDEKVPSGVADYTFGYLGRKTFWNWASGGGLDKKGRKIGFNFSQGVNETGFTENAFWIDGKLIKTGSVDFRYDDLHLLSQWMIVTNDGKVNLSFHPEGERSSIQNYLLISSRYHQLFGNFSGTLSEGRRVYTLDSVSGFAEEHEAKW